MIGARTRRIGQRAVRTRPRAATVPPVLEHHDALVEQYASMAHAFEPRPVDQLQQFSHVAPRVHARPADLSLRGEDFTKAVGDSSRLAERVSNPAGVFTRVRRPPRRVVSRIDPHGAVGTNPAFAESAREAA